MRFEWDRKKAETNRRKHGVSFEQAAIIFADRNALSLYDEEHSDEEERWVTMGLASEGRIIVAAHTYRRRGKQEFVRIISARKATKREITQYHNKRRG